MTSNIAESFVSGLVNSYREAYIRKEIVNPQIVVSLCVSTNLSLPDVTRFYSVINFAFDVSSSYIAVYFAESQAGFNDLSKMDWKFQSRHDSCWRSDGLEQITNYYFKAREHLFNELRALDLSASVDEINASIEITPHFNFFVPVKFDQNQLENFGGYALANMMGRVDFS